MYVDTSKPSVSRIYDYMLGGHHNFEVDRAVADQILKIAPSYPRWARLNRWFLQMVADRWAKDGFRHILDLGSGLPTQGHFHTVAPDAKVVYSDNDPMTVAYAGQVLEDNPNVRYVSTDIREPTTLLREADQLFGGQREVAIGVIGISYFLDDHTLARVMRALHSWAAPGSVLAFSFMYTTLESAEAREIVALLRRSGTELYPRDEGTVRRLCEPWQVQQLKPLASWLGMERFVQDEDRGGSDTEMYGVLLQHEK